MLVAAPVPAFTKEPLQLAPSSPWQINYSEDSCRLSRKFGTADQEVFLTIDRFQPGDPFYLVISGKLAKAYGSQDIMSIDFGPNEAMQYLDFRQGEQQLLAEQGGISDKRPAIIFTAPMRFAPYTKAEKAANADVEHNENYLPFEPAPIGPDREKAVNFILLSRPLSQPLLLMTGTMGAPFAALRQCTDELIGHWGVNAKALSTQSRQVQPDGYPGNWLNSSDYPTAMVAKGQQGIVHFRLSVDADGHSTACHIQQSTRPAEFDDAVCKGLMKRAKFKPALDVAGNPIASYYINTVRFQM